MSKKNITQTELSSENSLRPTDRHDHCVAVRAVEGVDSDDTPAVRGLHPRAALILPKVE